MRPFCGRTKQNEECRACSIAARMIPTKGAKFFGFAVAVAKSERREERKTLSDLGEDFVHDNRDSHNIFGASGNLFVCHPRISETHPRHLRF